MTTALVVGGAGFVGSNLVRRLLAHDPTRVDVVDNFLSSEPESVPQDPRVNLIVGSIADDDVLATIEDVYDVVFHLATFHGNQSSIADPIADHDNNLITTLKLFEHLKSFERLQKVVYAASGCTLAPHDVYNDATPITEEGAVPLDLDSPYQISKVVGEFYAVYYHRQHGLPTVRARFQNVYGPGEVLGAGRWRGTLATVWRNVTPTFAYRAIKGWPLQLDDCGRASRDFIYVDDISSGLVACAERGTPGDVYNLASGVETTIRELGEKVIALAESTSSLDLGERRPWDHSVRRLGSNEKARRELGFDPSTPLDEGLRSLIAWTRSELPYIERCIEQHKAELAR